MKVFYLNNSGGGFADHVEVEENTTVGQFFAERMKGGDPSNYLIRVDRLPCAQDQVLQPGSRVSITPTKVHGALARRLAA